MLTFRILDGPVHRSYSLGPTLFRSKRNYAQELYHLSRFPGPILRSMPVSLVLFQGLSEERLEEAAQANLQVSQRGAWRHAGAD
jgi:hypothetical protein